MSRLTNNQTDEFRQKVTTASLTSPTSSLPPYDCEVVEVSNSIVPIALDVPSGFESEGIKRVATEDRNSAHDVGHLHILLTWLSCNLTAENIMLAMLGPLQFRLPFWDSFACAVGGALVGSVPVAFVSTFGPKSGHRTMIISRYSMGWIPAKMIAFLNIAILIGYLIIDAVAAGQILSAVSTSQSLSIVIGIVISICLTGIVSTVGIKLFNVVEQHAWLLQLAALCILLGATVPNFDVSKPTASPAEKDKETILADRISFFNLCLAGSITYAPCAADMFVYLPKQTTTRKTFLQTMLGLMVSFAMTFLVGIGLASGVNTIPSWEQAYEDSPGSLIAKSLAPLGTLGTVTGVVLSLGVVANMVVPSYSISVSLQALGFHLTKVPRPFCSLAGLIICAICAVWGREHLAAILTNFVSLMGYWVVIWVTIFCEEHFLFRGCTERGYDWGTCDVSEKMPLGIAATVAFLSGWVGVVLCMRQTWFIGPVAALIGVAGADIANFVGFGWTAAVFPFMRWVELRIFRR